MRAFGLVFAFLTAVMAAQQPAPAKPDIPPPTAAPHDAAVEAASNLIGRALFLRCFCAENTLSFDAAGKVEGQGKTTDWTLAAVNVQKVERKGQGAVELDGVRVAIRYAADRHEFDRHPQNDEKVKLLIADNGDAAAFGRALRAVFSVGIDRALQTSMPEFWQHYFEPAKPWQDDLKGHAIYTPEAPGTPAGLVSPTPAHKVDAGYTAPATHDRVQGTSLLRMVVDTGGTTRRISVVQPLGYGLDARAAEAAEKYRFTPGTLAGKPADVVMLVKQDFVVVPTP